MSETESIARTGPKASHKKKAAPRRKARGRRAATQESSARLKRLLKELQSRASSAGKQIASASLVGAGAARRAAGKASTASKKAARAIRAEWKKLDTPRKIEFVAAILGALAATSGAVAARRKRR